MVASAPMTTENPVVDVSGMTVTHAGTAYTIRPLTETSWTVLVNGVPVGRIIEVFGTANAVVESPDVTEDALTAIGEAWFAATTPQ